MLETFDGRYRGFQAKRREGEIFEHEGNQWVIIRILNSKLIISNVPIVRTKLIGQCIGRYVDYSPYFKETSITDKYLLEGREPWDKNIRPIGDTLYLTDDDLRLPAIVTGIESFEYEFTDLVVKYRVEIIRPWSEQRMNKAIQENRLSTFKVISRTRSELNVKN